MHASVWQAPNPSAGLLLIHGMQSHSGWFEAAATAAEAAAAGITVLSYDRRGSGRSGGERGHVGSEQAFLDDLAAAHDGLVGELVQAGGEAAPVHALASCFERGSCSRSWSSVRVRSGRSS
ncbi:MAG: alpha/beta fold hydrolase [Thermoanaerobaculia bacterium]